MTLTETWLYPGVSKNARNVHRNVYIMVIHYFIIPVLLEDEGVGILVKDDIYIVRNKLPHLAHSIFEHIELLISAISIHIILVVVYRPPQSNTNKKLKCNYSGVW